MSYCFSKTTDLPWAQVYQGAKGLTRADHTAQVQTALVRDAGSNLAASPFIPQKIPKKLLTPVKLSSFLPLAFSSAMPHPFLIKTPHFSSTSHYDLSFVVSWEGINFPRCSLLVLPCWGELLLLFFHQLHGSNLDSH